MQILLQLGFIATLHMVCVSLLCLLAMAWGLHAMVQGGGLFTLLKEAYPYLPLFAVLLGGAFTRNWQEAQEQFEPMLGFLSVLLGSVFLAGLFYFDLQSNSFLSSVLPFSLPYSTLQSLLYLPFSAFSGALLCYPMLRFFVG
jgi:hypothetical protein